MPRGAQVSPDTRLPAAQCPPAPCPPLPSCVPPEHKGLRAFRLPGVWLGGSEKVCLGLGRGMHHQGPHLWAPGPGQGQRAPKQPGPPAGPRVRASPMTPNVGVVSRLHVIDRHPGLPGDGPASWPSWVNRPSPDRPAEGRRGREQEAREGPNGKVRCLARVCQGCCAGIAPCGSPGRRGQLLGLLRARGWGSSRHFV